MNLFSVNYQQLNMKTKYIFKDYLYGGNAVRAFE